MPIGLTGIAALEAEMRDRLKAKDGEIERLRAALACVVAAMDENHVAALHRPNACAVEADALRNLLRPGP